MLIVNWADSVMPVSKRVSKTICANETLILNEIWDLRRRVQLQPPKRFAIALRKAIRQQTYSCLLRATQNGYLSLSKVY